MGKLKNLTQAQYLAKFSRAVRWRLPPQEAEEAISDYRELIFQEERDESKLVEELGEPVQAAHLLTDVKTYRQWLKVFAVLALGLFLLAKWDFMGHSSFYLSSYDQWWYPVWVMAIGLPLSLYWFRRHGQKNGPLSKGLLLSLGTVLALGVVIMAWTWHVTDPAFLDYYAGFGGIPWHITLQRYLITYGGTACALAALPGLVLAKCYDRRWLALYTLALTAAAMCGFVIFIFKSMDLSVAIRGSIQAYIFARIIPIGAVGLVGTGVALC